VKTNNDKARILKDIIIWLDMGSDSHLRCGKRETVVGTHAVKLNWEGEIAPQFVTFGLFNRSVEPPKGSIVKCGTNPDHDWGIARYVSHNDDHYVLSEIGNPERTLRMYNEHLSVLVGVPWHVTAEGWERQMYEWAIKAILERWNERATYPLRFRGAEVHDDILTIKIGRHIWAATVRRETPEGTKTFRYRVRSFDIPVNKKTRLKDIVKTLHTQGFDATWSDDELEPDVLLSEGVSEGDRVSRVHPPHQSTPLAHDPL